MTFKLALPLVIALGTTTAAFAQDTTTGTDTSMGATGTPLDWDDATNDAFFSDITAGTLRADDEITANWANLTNQQQDRVRQHCETIGGDGTGPDGTAAGADGALSTEGSATVGDTATGDTTATNDTAATGSVTTEKATANMNQLCGVVTGL